MWVYCTVPELEDEHRDEQLAQGSLVALQLDLADIEVGERVFEGVLVGVFKGVRGV